MASRKWWSRHPLLALLAVALPLFAFTAPMPYVAMSPGPVTDTLGKVGSTTLIEIKGTKTYETDGELNLTTVSVTDPNSNVRGAFVLQSWILSDTVVIPRETVYPEGVSKQEVQQRNAEEMRLSQQNATTAALFHLGYDLPSTIRVVRIIADSPAQGALKAADRIIAVDGKAITETQQVPDFVRARTPGDPVTFTVMRNGTERRITMKTITGPEGQPLVGIAAAAVYTYPFEVNIRLEAVGGPSAGLMFALGIIDRLTPESLTKGRVIAGTGTIDDDGNVGSIGGIGEKLKGARGAGATLFLAPAENCKDITSVPDGLRVISVTTLAQAVKILESETIPTGPRCGP